MVSDIIFPAQIQELCLYVYCQRHVPGKFYISHLEKKVILYYLQGIFSAESVCIEML